MLLVMNMFRNFKIIAGFGASQPIKNNVTNLALEAQSSSLVISF